MTTEKKKKKKKNIRNVIRLVKTTQLAIQLPPMMGKVIHNVGKPTHPRIPILHGG